MFPLPGSSGGNGQSMRRWIFVILALICITTDQLSKFWAENTLKNDQVPVLGGLVHLNLSSNTGGAFGIFPSSPAFFTIVGGIIVLLMLILIKRIMDMPVIYQVALALVGGGAIGNLTDRLKQGFVTDFIDLKFWPIFNLADFYITIGVFILAYLFLVEKRKEEN